MKKHKFIALTALCAITMYGCKGETEGTDPGSDPNPYVTLYQYAPTGSPGEGLPPYNPDEDVIVRFAANEKVTEYYYLVQLLNEKQAYIDKNSEESYSDYVISNGVKVGNNLNNDVIMQGLAGTYAVTVVAQANGSGKKSSEMIFYGLKWETLAEGTYEYVIPVARGFVTSNTIATTLQVCTTDEYLYRFKDLYGAGYSLKLVALPDYIDGPDADGDTFIFCRIPTQNTPFSYLTYGAVIVRDVGYWQNNIAYITDYGYESGICIDGPDKYFAYISPQYNCSGGSLGYGFWGNANIEFFYPD